MEDAKVSGLMDDVYDQMKEVLNSCGRKSRECQDTSKRNSSRSSHGKRAVTNEADQGAENVSKVRQVEMPSGFPCPSRKAVGLIAR